MGQSKFLPIVFASILSLVLFPLVIEDSFGGAILPNPIPNPFLGDFKCYLVPPQDILSFVLQLDDQFGRELVGIDHLEKICAYVQKQEGTTFPPSPDTIDTLIPFQHFDVYPIFELEGPTPGTVRGIVEVTDQFGTEIHQVTDPVELWVPADKLHFQCPPDTTFDPASGLCDGTLDPIEQPPSPDLNTPNPETNGGIHYKCYIIDQVPIEIEPLILIDQFFLGQLNILAPADRLCVPVQKTVLEPFLSESFGVEIPDHLKCYPIVAPITIDALLILVDQFTGFEIFPQIIEDRFCSLATKVPVTGLPIGGTFIPTDTTSLLLAGAQMTASWLIPVIVAGAGFVWFLGSRKSE